MLPMESAVIEPMPEAERAVSAWRSRLDPAAGWGVPAHVTVLYPFLAPERIDQAELELLARAVRTVPRFDIELTRVEWFGDSVIWLAPEPDAPFRALTAAVWNRFPEAPPYGGEHADNMPHLTVGHGGPAFLLREADEAVRPQLPIKASVGEARLICGSRQPNSWYAITELPLGTVTQS